MTLSTSKTIMPLTRPTLTRRAFVKAGGGLVVSLGLSSVLRGGIVTVEAAQENTLDATQLSSWLEVRSDNTILARTGKTETGTSAPAMYAQIIAEELSIQPESVSLVLGHTDKTPDGGYSAGFLGGAANLRKVAAYTYRALLELASAQLGVPIADLSVMNGTVSGSGKSVSYGQLVEGQQLDLIIPVSGDLPSIDPTNPIGITGLAGISVSGNPPTKAISDYTVVGVSHPSSGIPDIVTGKTKWSCDVRLSGMLHARMIRPATVGSTLVSVGQLDKSRFPNAEVVTRENLVAVLSPNEWEAVQAARSVAEDTKWTDWSGLPSSNNLTKEFRARDWGQPLESRGDVDKTNAGLANATKTISVSYEQPYVRHAPIGPYVAVADVSGDGTVTVWSQSSQPQGLRAQIANTLGTSVDKVIIRWLEHSGQYGRVTYGGDGAQADAAILSQIVGKPVRVQWTLQEDLTWSTTSPGWIADIKAGLDAQGSLIAFRSDWYSPHESDARLLGAVLAGMPTVTPKVELNNRLISTVWPYDKVPAVLEQGYSMPNLGADAPSTGGLRGNIMRTPYQRQQNFALESVINEVASAVGSDPIEFRINHTSNQRLIEIMKATAEEAKWQSRPSPQPDARSTGSAVVKGRGIGVIIRSGGHWAGIAEIEIVPNTGVIRVTTFVIGVDVGKVINPRHLKSAMRGGVVQGLSEALKEEVTFDSRNVTSNDWNRYRILTMEETPEIKTVYRSHDDRGMGGGGEAANALSTSAVAAAFFDATGIQPRRIPLTPEYVRTLLTA